MSWTKRQIVNQALEEIGLASYEFDLEAEDLQSVLRKLDMMLAVWNGKGIRIGYPLVGSPENSDLDTESNVTDMAVEAIVLNLACRIAPMYGKQLSRETKQYAHYSYKTLLSLNSKPNEMRFPETLPTGQGQKPWRYYGDEYINDPETTVDAGNDTDIDLY